MKREKTVHQLAANLAITTVPTNSDMVQEINFSPSGKISLGYYHK
jgi:hypothetical protein